MNEEQNYNSKHNTSKNRLVLFNPRNGLLKRRKCNCQGIKVNQAETGRSAPLKPRINVSRAPEFCGMIQMGEGMMHLEKSRYHISIEGTAGKASGDVCSALSPTKPAGLMVLNIMAAYKATSFCWPDSLFLGHMEETFLIKEAIRTSLHMHMGQECGVLLGRGCTLLSGGGRSSEGCREVGGKERTLAGM